MNRPMTASGGPLPTRVARALAPATVARRTVPRRASVLLHVMLFAVVALMLGRLHDLSSITSRIPVGKVLLPIGWLVLLAQPGVRRRFQVLRTTQAGMFLLLNLALVLSVPLSLWRGGSTMEYVGFLQSTVPFVLLMAVACAEERDLYVAARAVVVTGAVLGLAFLAGMGRGAEGRLSLGTTYDANDIALVGVMVLPLAVWQMRDRARIWRWIGVAGGAGALVAIVMSASRGGMLGLGVVLLLIAVRYRKRIPLHWRITSVVLLVVALRFAPATFWTRFETLKDPSADYNTFDETGRVAIWTRGLAYFASRPLWGVGLGQFGQAEYEWGVRTQGRTAGFQSLVPHSVWIQLLAEIGLLGFVGFLGLYLPTLRDVLKSRLRTPSRAPPHPELQAMGDALGISIVGFFVCGTFLAMAYSPPAMLLAAIGMSYSRISRQAIAATEPSERTPRTRRGWVGLGQRPRI